MITYVFPPSAWVGAHRTLKYCKYLSIHGWTPVVLTAKPIGVTFKDENLLRQVPAHVSVHRTFDIDPAKWEARFAERKLKRRNLAADTAYKVPEASTVPKSPVGSSGLLTRTKNIIKAVVTDSPDSHIFWVPFAFITGVWILLKEKIAIIYCTSPPHSSHFVAFLLAKLFSKPLLLDFRDPWHVDGSVRIPAKKIPWLLYLETRAKRMFVRHAARVICVSRGECNELKAEFPELSDYRFTYITNGFDPSDLAVEAALSVDEARELSRGKLKMLHAGTIYSGIAGELFEALQQLLAQDSRVADKIQVDLLGEISDDYTDAVRELEKSGILKVHGLQPHAITMRMIAASDVLLLLMGGTKFLPSHLPSKLYEYLHVGKPILAIAQEGEATEIARQSGLGIVVAPRSISDLVDALGKLVADQEAGRLARVPNRAFIRSFDRKVLTAKLAAVLDEVAGKNLGRG